MDVRVTRHGPLVSDAINAINAESKATPKPPPVEPLAFRWTALDPDDGTLAAFLKVNEARNWTEFTDALRGYVVPSQNFVYADVDGHIGYYAPGRIPLRASGDGSRPADGWTGDAEWTGWVPFDELPHTFDPPEHFIVTANHRPAPASYGYNLGLEWTEPFRARRITDLLRDKTKLTPDTFARISGRYGFAAREDVVADAAAHTRAMSPRRPAGARRAAPMELRRHRRQRRDGDLPGVVSPADAGARRRRPRPPVEETYQGTFSFVTRFLLNARWLRTTRRGATTSRRRAWRRAMTRWLSRCGKGSRICSGGWAVTSRAGGGTPCTARCSRTRSTRSRRCARSSAVDRHRRRLEYRQRRRDRGRSSIRRAYGPRLPEIIDLSPANDSRFLDAVGQSGHVLSPHYDDFLSDWRAVKHRKMRMDRADIEKARWLYTFSTSSP